MKDQKELAEMVVIFNIKRIKLKHKKFLVTLAVQFLAQVVIQSMYP